MMMSELQFPVFYFQYLKIRLHLPVIAIQQTEFMLQHLVKNS